MPEWVGLDIYSARTVIGDCSGLLWGSLRDDVDGREECEDRRQLHVDQSSVRVRWKWSVEESIMTPLFNFALQIS